MGKSWGDLLVPAIGDTVVDVYEAWRMCPSTSISPDGTITSVSGRNVVTGKVFSFHHGGAVLMEEKRRKTKNKSFIALLTSPAQMDEKELFEAIRLGQFQIEEHIRFNLKGVGQLEYGKLTRIIHQATNKPIPVRS